ncbi:MAG: alpha/beta hydrolase, partial [Opitutae bacterium]
PVLESNSLEANDHYAGPALFIAGGLSPYVQASDQALIHRSFPAARLAVIADSGHNPHMDRREELVRLVVGG